jgi:hypothetical protein
MIGAAAYHAHLIARLRWQARILFQQLGVAADGIERRSQFMT